jgi:hypothetical protein
MYHPVDWKKRAFPHEVKWQENDVMKYLNIVSRIKNAWSCLSTFKIISDPVLS